jgi:hypothetical protein
MLHPSKFTKNRSQDLRSLRRFRAQPRVEELEARTLLSAYTPLQIQQAYGINQISFNAGAVKGDGTGQTIALVDAYYDPTIQSDLTAFSQKYGLSLLDGKNGDGTFTQANLSNLGTKNLSPANDDWTLETALDVEWAHAMAPKANIVLVEAASDSQDPNTGEPTALLNAVQYAATNTGAAVVSMSWGISEVPLETSWDSFFTTPGVTFVAASGDNGAGTIWPAVSPDVVSVGGTTLKLTRSNTISSETGWGYGSLSRLLGGSGGGFSQYEPLPSYQQNSGISTSLTQFGARLNPDVAYDADPSTGFSVVNAGSWTTVGGTSAGAPQWAALIAIADQGRALDGLSPLGSTQTLSAFYSNPSDFHDITKGSRTGVYALVDNNGSIVGRVAVTPGPGYDLVTGLGTPIANVLVSAAKGGIVSPSVISSSSSSGGSSGYGSGANSRTLGGSVNSGKTPASLDAPNSPAGIPTSDLSAIEASLALTNASGARGSAVPVATISPSVPPAFTNAPTVLSTPLLLASPSGGSPRIESGGGGDFPAQEDLVPMLAAPVVPWVLPSGSVPQAPAPQRIDPAPAVPDVLDNVFLQDESAPGRAPSGALPELHSAADGTASRPELSAAVLGLVVFLALHAQDQSAPAGFCAGWPDQRSIGRMRKWTCSPRLGNGRSASSGATCGGRSI